MTPTPLFNTEKKPITEADKMRLGADLAQANLDLEEMEEEKSDASRAYRVKIRQIKEQISTLSRQRNDGIIEFQFEVVEEPDDESFQMVVYRKSPRERLSTRPMNEAEKESARKRKQAVLFDDDGNPVQSAKAAGRGGKAAKVGKPKAKSNGHAKR